MIIPLPFPSQLIFLSLFFAGIVMFISAAVKNNVLTLLLSLAVVYGPMMIAEYLPYGMQKALDLIPMVGSSTYFFISFLCHIIIYAFILLDQLFIANGIHRIPIKTGIVISR